MRKNFHMKKVVMLAVAMLLAAAPVALADSVITNPDLQDVRAYSGIAPTNYLTNWMDVIGTPGDANSNGFNTSKVVLTFTNPGATYYKDLKVDLYTNYPSTGNVSGGGDVAADVILSLNGGINNYGIAMTTHGGLTQGTLYAVGSLASSIDRWGSKGGIYGGAWDDSSSDTDPGNTAWTYITGTTGSFMDASSFNWGAGDGVSQYMVSISYAGYNATQSGGLNTLTGFWGTGDCSNDGIAFTGTGSPVPLPPSVLLLGSGLLGLALLGKRQIRKSE